MKSRSVVQSWPVGTARHLDVHGDAGEDRPRVRAHLRHGGLEEGQVLLLRREGERAALTRNYA